MVDLSEEKKQAILVECARLSDPVTGKLMHGALKIILATFDPISKSTVMRLRRRYGAQQAQGILCPNVSNRKKGRCGAKSKLSDRLQMRYKAIMQAYANNLRWCSERALQAALRKLGVPLGLRTIARHLKLLKSSAVNLRLNSTLTDVQKRKRVDFILDKVDRNHGLHRVNHNHQFKNLLNCIHVDESWFYMQNQSNRVRTMPGIMIPPHPKAQLKVMFLVAMARPQMKPDGTWFDGKIGMWPCTERVVIRRGSINRPRNVLETKPKSVDAAFYVHLFTKAGGVVEKIKEKMPWLRQAGHVIQHDGAGPHTADTENQINDFGSRYGWNISIHKQPPQSPDLNILDLGLFASMKSRQADLLLGAKTIDALIIKIRTVFDQYPSDKLDSIWAHQFDCYTEILRCDGENTYKPPLTGAPRQRTNAWSKVDLSVDIGLVNAVYNV